MTIKELRSYLRVQCQKTHKKYKRAELSNGEMYFEGKLAAYEEILKIATSMIKEEKAFEDSLLHDQDERERI